MASWIEIIFPSTPEPSGKGTAISTVTEGSSVATSSAKALMDSICPESPDPSKATVTRLTPAAAKASNSTVLLAGRTSASSRARSRCWAK